MVRPKVRHKNLLGCTIANGRLEFVAVLGIGAYGVVYLARDTAHVHHYHRYQDAGPSTRPDIHAIARYGSAATGYYAVKCLNKLGLDSRQRAFQRRETLLHTMASNHPNIVTLHRVFDSPTSPYVYIVLDYCPDGDLFAMVTEAQLFSLPQEPFFVDPNWSDGRPVSESPLYTAKRAATDGLIKDVFDQILSAVEHCHSIGLYHRDIKPENILCGANGKQVFIADFGLATGDRYSTDFGCGSSFYMGPECQGGITKRLERYNTAANDVWSLGVILINLVCSRNPWKEATRADETFCEYLANPNFLMEILPISEALNSLLQRVFCINEEKRCTVSEFREGVKNLPSLVASNNEVWARQNREIEVSKHTQDAELPMFFTVNNRKPTTVDDIHARESDSPISSPSSGPWDQNSRSGSLSIYTTSSSPAPYQKSQGGASEQQNPGKHMHVSILAPGDTDAIVY